MLATRETVFPPSESNFKSTYREDEKFENFWHYHPEYEITLIMSGQGQKIIGDEIMNYNSPELIFIPPKVPHTCISENENELQKALVIQFHKNCFGNDFFDGIDFNELKPLFSCPRVFKVETSQKAEVLMRKIHASIGLERIINLLKLLRLLNSDLKSSYTLSKSPLIISDPKAHDTMNRIMSTLLQKTDYSIPALAKNLAMSESTLRRFFKKHTGRSIIDFHNEMKINAACLSMQNQPSTAISDIAQSAGFKNLSHFNRQFQKWKNCQPREFRSKFK